MIAYLTSRNHAKYYVALALFVLADLLVVCATPGVTQVERPAPEFTALDVAGRPINLADYKGQKHVVLVFYLRHT